MDNGQILLADTILELNSFGVVDFLSNRRDRIGALGDHLISLGLQAEASELFLICGDLCVAIEKIENQGRK